MLKKLKKILNSILKQKNILPILAGIVLICLICKVGHNAGFVEGFVEGVEREEKAIFNPSAPRYNEFKKACYGKVRNYKQLEDLFRKHKGNWDKAIASCRGGGGRRRDDRRSPMRRRDDRRSHMRNFKRRHRNSREFAWYKNIVNSKI